MRKLFLMVSFFIVSKALLAVPEVGIGDEYITPLSYPKFAMAGDYTFGRWFHGFYDPSLRLKVANRFGAALSFEAGLLKYFNAGAIFTFCIPNFGRSEPLDMRMALFAKNYLPIGTRLSLFIRSALGVTVAQTMGSFSPVDYFAHTSDEFKPNFNKLYGGQEYAGTPWGGFGSATVGVDFFPFSRLGLSLEWGIRADLLHMSKNSPWRNEDKQPKSVPGAPNAFNYLMYDLPLVLTLQVIL